MIGPFSLKRKADTFQNMKYKWLINNEKCSTSLDIREIKSKQY
jgi:hypothetical protein